MKASRIGLALIVAWGLAVPALAQTTKPVKADKPAKAKKAEKPAKTEKAKKPAKDAKPAEQLTVEAELIIDPNADGIDAKAEQALLGMCLEVMRRKAFSVSMNESFDQPDGGSVIKYHNNRRVVVQKPSTAATLRSGNSPDVRFFTDGERVLLYDVRSNSYILLPGSGTLDLTLDQLARDFSIYVPLSELAQSDPFAALMENVETARYVGVSRVNNVVCDHLLITEPHQTWQLWIDQRKRLPVKLVVTFTDMPGHPQYEANFTGWRFDVDEGALSRARQIPFDATRIALPGAVEAEVESIEIGSPTTAPAAE